MYNQAYYFDNYLIGLSAKILFADSLYAGLSSSKSALDLLILGFIAKATCLGNYFAVTLAH